MAAGKIERFQRKCVMHFETVQFSLAAGTACTSAVTSFRENSKLLPPAAALLSCLKLLLLDEPTSDRLRKKEFHRAPGREVAHQLSSVLVATRRCVRASLTRASALDGEARCAQAGSPSRQALCLPRSCASNQASTAADSTPVLESSAL